MFVADISKITIPSGTVYDIKAKQLVTPRAIDGVNFNGSSAIIHYSTCSTSAGTAAKTAACTGFTLVTGAWIAIKFTVTNTAAVANLTLNVNSTGAKNIKYRNSNLSNANVLSANRVYLFVYDGTYWQIVGDLDTDNNTTYTLSQSATDGHIITLTPSSGTAQTITIPDNDTKVTQTNSATGDWRPVLLGYDHTADGTQLPTAEVTNTVFKTVELRYRPSVGMLTTKQFSTSGYFDTTTDNVSFYTSTDGNIAFRRYFNPSTGDPIDLQRVVLRTYAGKCDGTGMLLSLGGGGMTIVYSGESGHYLAQAIADDTSVEGSARLDVSPNLTTGFTGGSEHLLLSSDQNIYFITGCNYSETDGIEKRVAVVLNNKKEFYPDLNKSGSIGISDHQWKNVYAENVYENGVSISNKYIPLSGSDQISGDLKMNATQYGLYLVDSTGFSYCGIRDNGSNMWIGMRDSASPAHTGVTYISTGYNANTNTGNETIMVTVPNDTNTGSSGSYGVLHKGNTFHNITTTDDSWTDIGVPLDSSYAFKVVRGGTGSGAVNPPEWWGGSNYKYGAGIVFGGSDSAGSISMRSSGSIPGVTFASGNKRTDATKPRWYFSLTGTSGQTYDLSQFKSGLYAGSDSDGGAATNVATTLTNPTTSTSYAIPFHSSTGTGSRALRNNNGIRYITLEGTTTSKGYGILVLGNDTAESTDANKYGLLRLYTTGSTYVQWTAGESDDSLRFYHSAATTGANVSPAANNKYDLGTSSLRWRQIHASAIIGGGSNGTYIEARDVALIRLDTGSTTTNSFFPGLSMKTGSGAWSIGTNSANNNLYFSYTDDTDYQSSSNTFVNAIMGMTRGTTTSTGYTTFTLGNSVATGEANNNVGRVSLYSPSTYQGTIVPTSLTSAKTYTLPDYEGHFLIANVGTSLEVGEDVDTLPTGINVHYYSTNGGRSASLVNTPWTSSGFQLMNIPGSNNSTYIKQMLSPNTDVIPYMWRYRSGANSDGSFNWNGGWKTPGTGFISVIGTQTATTASWTGSLPIPQLYDGLTIAYYLPYTSAANVTLNLTLSNGTTTGAIDCYFNANTRLGTQYGAGSTIILTYWGAGSISINGIATTEASWRHCDYNTNTNVTQNRISTNSNRPLLLSNYAVGSTTTTAAAVVRATDDSMYANPSTGTLTVNHFVVGKQKTVDGAVQGSIKFFSGNSSDVTDTSTLMVEDTVGSGNHNVYLPTRDGIIPILERLYTTTSSTTSYDTSVTISNVNGTDYDMLMIVVSLDSTDNGEMYGAVASAWVPCIPGVHQVPLIWGAGPASGGGSCYLTSAFAQIATSSTSLTVTFSKKTRIATMGTSSFTFADNNQSAYIRRIYGLKCGGARD